MQQFNISRQLAKELDDSDKLSTYRNKFFMPQHSKHDAIYLCGNSLGLQPKHTADYFKQELEDWAKFGVEGHFEAEHPWFKYHHFFKKSLADIVGAKDTEVVAMNTLTVNLHLLMLSFYRPTKTRYKIIMEAGAFPSDMYAVETQVLMHGFKTDQAIIEVAPRKGEHTIREEDIMKAIEKNKSSVALVLFGGVNYYTGQLFNIKNITEAAHKAGAKCGFDLAHAVGNIPLKLHDWGVDFACWCSYKYLNSGPGGVGGIFVHEKHCKDKKTFRLAGWWGHDEKTRFKMQKGFVPMPTAESWQMSNAQVFNMVAHRASLDIFDDIGMKALREKSKQLTAYCYYLLKELKNVKFDIITPENEEERGCQLSLLFDKNGKKIFTYLQSNGVIADWREPNCIRIAPVPLYNSYEDVYEFYSLLLNYK
jgi:kynureninase